MICKICKIEMAVGYAIDPMYKDSVCTGMGGGPRSIGWDDLRLIYVWKCEKCGHSEIDDNDPTAPKRAKMKELGIES